MIYWKFKYLRTQHALAVGVSVDKFHTDYDNRSVKAPKEIAFIKICGSVKFVITEGMDFVPPTKEQIKNLKTTFNIDVEVLENLKGGL